MARLLCLILVTCYWLQLARAECCFNNKGFQPHHYVFRSQSGECEDGTQGTPCCGYGRCNWNCCECTTPCRQRGKGVDQAIEERRLAQNPHLHAQESRLILPKKKNNGAPLDNLRDHLEHRLIQDFGGYTRDESNGGWTDNASGRVYKESVWVYDITSAGTDEQIKKLNNIARWLLEQAEQEAIYLRLPGGKVTFVEGK